MGILEILGIVFLIILLVVGYYAFKILRWFKKTTKGVNESTLVHQILPPVRMEVFKQLNPEWVNKSRLAKDVETLKRAGFVDGGCYETTMGMAESIIWLWSHPQKGVLAAVYEVTTFLEDKNENLTVYVIDLFLQFSDNSSLTVNNNPYASTLPRPSNHKQVSNPEIADFAGLFKTLKENAPAGVKVKPVGQPLDAFLDFCHEHNGWLWEEEQLRSKEVGESLAAVGVEMTDDLLADLLEHAAYEKSEIIKEKVMQKVATSKKVTVEQWEKCVTTLL